VTQLDARPPGKSKNPSPIRTLIVDESLLWAQRFIQLFRDARGITVIGVAQDGVEALSFATTVRPALMLIEMNMAGMNGLATTEAVRSRFRGVRVVMMSADDAGDARAKCMAHGAHAFVGKTERSGAFLAAIFKLFPAHRPVPRAPGTPRLTFTPKTIRPIP
jgi:DNA-binding NarL/FixJ family response regulator